MSGSTHGMAAVESVILFAIARPDPRSATALDRDTHLLVGRELKVVFESFDFSKIHGLKPRETAK